MKMWLANKVAKSQFTLDCPVMRQGHPASKRHELVQQIVFEIGISFNR